MTILNFLDKYGSEETQSATAETSERLSRRFAFRKMGQLAKDAALVGLPLGVALLSPNRAAAQSGGGMVIDVLNFALTLEYLEAEFYVTGLDANGLLTGRNRDIIAQISKHETAHVNFLQTAISAAGGTPVESPTFDFTAGGAFSDVFSNPDTFLALAQAFEDTGVRAYKGQAANLLGTGDVLTAALQIHSVEARHAAEVRRLRGSKAWITGSMNTTAPAADAVYAGEGNTTHLGVNAGTIVSVDNDALTEAYDEPLTMQEVLAIASLFIEQ